MASRHRKAVPKSTEAEVLLLTRRRCPICFGLKGDLGEKQGQVAHLDHDPSNNSADNLAYLCLAHHDEFDSKRSQSKGITLEEAKRYRDELVKTLSDWPVQLENEEKSRGRKKHVAIDLEVFDRRLAIYRIVRDFLQGITSSGEVDLDAIRKFAQDTEEALFLFDEKVSRYLDEIYRRSVELRAVSKRLEAFRNREASESSLGTLLDKDTELLMWFTAQFGEVRRLLKEYMHL
jgi:hypothetical protein